MKENNLSQHKVEVQGQPYRELFDFVSDAYLATNPYGIIQEANRAAANLLHVRQEFLVGKPVGVYVAREAQKGFRDLLIRLLKKERAEECEMRMKPREGASFPVALTVAPVRGSDGRLVGFRWLLLDITERKKAEEELRKAHSELERRVKERTAELTKVNEALQHEITARKRAEEVLRESEQRFRNLAKEREEKLIISDRLVSVGELAASIAHEFNNALQIITGFTQDLLTEVEPGHRHYQPLKVIEKEAGRCTKIVRDLLDFIRPTIADRQSIDLKSILRNSIDLVASHLEKAKVEIEIEMPPVLPQIYADPQQLEQVLLNLYFNAAEAMPRGGTLTIRVAANSGSPRHSLGNDPDGANEVMIAITDTGLGIPADDLANVFRPFFTTKNRGGMGLGLSICQSIIKSHGGRIEVESKAGHGTTFFIYLPLEGEATWKQQLTGS
ncbi:MAG: ATP-binding protein [Candidatus Binatia bacterium]